MNKQEKIDELISKANLSTADAKRASAKLNIAPASTINDLYDKIDDDDFELDEAWYRDTTAPQSGATTLAERVTFVGKLVKVGSTRKAYDERKEWCQLVFHTIANGKIVPVTLSASVFAVKATQKVSGAVDNAGNPIDDHFILDPDGEDPIKVGETYKVHYLDCIAGKTHGLDQNENVYEHTVTHKRYDTHDDTVDLEFDASYKLATDNLANSVLKANKQAQLDVDTELIDKEMDKLGKIRQRSSDMEEYKANLDYFKSLAV